MCYISPSPHIGYCPEHNIIASYIILDLRDWISIRLQYNNTEASYSREVCSFHQWSTTTHTCGRVPNGLWRQEEKWKNSPACSTLVVRVSPSPSHGSHLTAYENMSTSWVNVPWKYHEVHGKSLKGPVTASSLISLNDNKCFAYQYFPSHCLLSRLMLPGKVWQRANTSLAACSHFTSKGHL